MKSQQVDSETFILFTADNGYFHGEHGLADKWYPYEEALRVPLIVRDPKMTRAQRATTSAALALNIDIAPTLLAAAGVEVPKVMQGAPLQAIYQMSKESSPKWRDEYYYEHPVIIGKDRIPRSEAVISGSWRYIYWPDYAHEQLFDLATDPHQERNDGTTQHPQILAQLRENMKDLRARAQGG